MIQLTVVGGWPSQEGLVEATDVSGQSNGAKEGSQAALRTKDTSSASCGMRDQKS